MIEIYKQMMKKVNIEIEDTIYDVPVSKDSERNVKKFLDENPNSFDLILWVLDEKTYIVYKEKYAKLINE